MDIRCVVTNVSAEGSSVIEADGQPTQVSDFKAVPGFRTAMLWATDDFKLPEAGASAKYMVTSSWVPPVGGTRAMIVTFPPDSVMLASDFDGAAAGQEYLEELPGLAEKFELDCPGMHTTESFDYGVVMEGDIVLELDNGKTVTLKSKDVVVQNGTRHAWRNPFDYPATMLFVLIGAQRTS